MTQFYRSWGRRRLPHGYPEHRQASRALHAVSAGRDVQRRLEVRMPFGWRYCGMADDKVNQLVSSLIFAVLAVVIFIGIFLGP